MHRRVEHVAANRLPRAGLVARGDDELRELPDDGGVEAAPARDAHRRERRLDLRGRRLRLRLRLLLLLLLLDAQR